MVNEQDILLALEDVKDPEIPTVSVVDLGMITEIKILDANSVSVAFAPTFAGCPALHHLKEAIRERVEAMGIANVIVKSNFDVAWDTNRITAKGIEGLKKHGLAPPPKHDGYIELSVISHPLCPFCNSADTFMQSPFGPTLCRSIHYCNSCLQAFEQFKPVG